MKSRDVIQFLFETSKSSTPLSPQQLTEVRACISYIPTLARLRREEIAVHQEIKVVCPKVEIPHEISLNTPDERDFTMLMHAADLGHLAMVQVLIEAKVDLNLQNKRGDTALMWASSSGHSVIVRELIKAGANPNIRSIGHRTALFRVSGRSTRSTCMPTVMVESDERRLIVQNLIEAKVDLNLQDEEGDTALMWASCYGHSVIVRELIKAGANPNIRNIQHRTALFEVSNFYEFKFDVDRRLILQNLVEAKAEVNIKDAKDETALLCAIYHGYSDIVHKLVEAKADVNIKDAKGHTALFRAVRLGWKVIAQKLIEAGAELEFQDQDGKTALDIAIKGQQLPIVRLLLSHGAHILHPQELLNFLKICHQQDQDVLVSLECLYKQLNSRSPIERNEIEAKQAMALISKHDIGPLYIKKLKDLHTANKGLCFLWTDAAFSPPLPRDIIEIIMGYEDRDMVLPQSRIVFLEPSTLDSPFQDLISEIREKTKKTPELFDKVTEEIDYSSFPGSLPVKTPEKEYKSVISNNNKLLGMIGVGQGSSGLGVGIALVVTGLSLTGGWILLAASALILLTCLLKAAADCYNVKKAYEQQRLFLPNVSSVPQSSVSPPRLQIGLTSDG